MYPLPTLECKDFTQCSMYFQPVLILGECSLLKERREKTTEGQKYEILCKNLSFIPNFETKTYMWKHKNELFVLFSILLVVKHSSSIPFSPGWGSITCFCHFLGLQSLKPSEKGSILIVVFCSPITAPLVGDEAGKQKLLLRFWTSFFLLSCGFLTFPPFILLPQPTSTQRCEYIAAAAAFPCLVFQHH